MRYIVFLIKTHFLHEFRSKKIIFLSIFSALYLFLTYKLGYQIENFSSQYNGKELLGLDVNFIGLIYFGGIYFTSFFLCTLSSVSSLKEDLENKMSSQFLLLPYPRWHYLLGKFLGTWFLTLIFFALFFILGAVFSLFPTISVTTLLLLFFNSVLIFPPVILACFLLSSYMPSLWSLILYFFIRLTGLAIAGSVEYSTYISTPFSYKKIVFLFFPPDFALFSNSPFMKNINEFIEKNRPESIPSISNLSVNIHLALLSVLLFAVLCLLFQRRSFGR